jgi:hypothetical protein
MDRYCEYCGEEMKVTYVSRKRFCGAKCRIYWHRKKDACVPALPIPAPPDIFDLLVNTNTPRPAPLRLRPPPGLTIAERIKWMEEHG